MPSALDRRLCSRLCGPALRPAVAIALAGLLLAGAAHAGPAVSEPAAGPTPADAAAAAPEATEVAEAAPVPGAAAPATEAAAPPTEAAVLQATAEAGLAAVAALEAQAKSLPGGEQALAQQASIEQAKRDLQRQLLLVQLDFARRDGRDTKAAAIEAVLQRMAAPPAVEPQARPLPSNPAQAR